MNTQTTRLPQAFSQINPAFASKADYLGFVQEWKTVYRYLSLSIRAARVRSRLRPNNRPEKKIALEKELAVVSAALATMGPCLYVEQGVSYGGHHVALGSTAATWLLELRAAAKVEAARRRAAALAGKEGQGPAAAG